jgi:hypothetical protein
VGVVPPGTHAYNLDMPLEDDSISDCPPADAAPLRSGELRPGGALEAESSVADSAFGEMPSAEEAATAYHEAGHAVMALYLGRPIHKVSIVPGQSDIGVRHAGNCRIQKGSSRASKDWLEDEVLILLAGLVAESRWTGREAMEGAAQDLRMVRRFVESRAGSGRQTERLERRWLSKTEHILSDPVLWWAVERIAEELLHRKSISGRNARHWFERAQTQGRD